MQAKFDESVRNNPLTPKKVNRWLLVPQNYLLKKSLTRETFNMLYRENALIMIWSIRFATGNFEASTRDEAKSKAAKLAKVQERYIIHRSNRKDIEGDNSITYYSRNKLLAA